MARFSLLLATGLFSLAGPAVCADQAQPADPTTPAATVAREASGRVRLGRSPINPEPDVGMPFALDDSAPKSEEQATKGNEWVVAPIPFVNPLVGTGLAGGAAYIYHPRGQDKKLSPWTTGLGGFYSDSKSWAAAVFHKMNLREDAWRLTGAAGYGELNYDFYGIGAAADSGQLVSLAQTASGGMVEGLYRLKEHLYAGLGYTLSNVKTGYKGDNLPSWIDDLNSQGQLSAVLSIPALRMQWDSRDNSFLPTSGSLIDGELSLSEEKFGSDFSFQTFLLTAKRYWKLSDRSTLAAYGFGRFAFGNVPFFELSMIGAKGNLRGYSVGRYQDLMALTGQVEYRWQAWRRLGLVAFAGVGAVAPDWSGFSHTTALPSIGGGVRYLLTDENKINLRLDVAWGKDEYLVYLGVGEAF